MAPEATAGSSRIAITWAKSREGRCWFYTARYGRLSLQVMHDQWEVWLRNERVFMAPCSGVCTGKQAAEDWLNGFGDHALERLQRADFREKQL